MSSSPAAVPLPTVSSRPPVILLRSGWQSANIGDIAHTPGVLRVFEEHAPEAEFILWPGFFDRGVEPMLRRRFPRLRFVRDAEQWKPEFSSPADCSLAEAFARADLLLHSSGPGLVGASNIERWLRETGKPWAAFGITVGSAVGSIDTSPDFPETLVRLLSTAATIYTRETRSLEAARHAGVTAPLAFSPDATFALDDLRNEPAADALLAQHRLETDRFLCVIPRLRLTPYWRMHRGRPYTPEAIATRDAFNATHAESDFGVLRAAIVHWVRTTQQRVLLCPEMTYETELFEPHFVRRLPPEIRPYVATLDRYWIADEASSVYARAALVVSMECHSPILAIACGRPAIYVHQPQDTWKVQMYPDLGLADWTFPIEQAGDGRLAHCMTEIHRNRSSALSRATAAKELATELLARSARQVMQLAAGHSETVPPGA